MSAQTASQQEMFEFVQLLARQLSSDSIQLPSFPDVVIRLRQVLEDERSTTAQIVQLLAAEPALAARLLQIANSAALRAGTSEITHLNMAVTRLGRNMVRNSAMAYAVKQMREAQKLEAAQSYLEEIWSDSTQVAALCYVLTKRFTKLNPESALLVGLLHGIGKLYILSQAETHPHLLRSDEDLRAMLRDWHAAIGSSILQTWSFPEEVSSAVARCQEVEREHEGPIDLTDILIVAHVLAAVLKGDDSEVNLNDVPASRQLDIGAQDLRSVLQEMNEHVSSLKHALGG